MARRRSPRSSVTPARSAVLAALRRTETERPPSLDSPATRRFGELAGPERGLAERLYRGVLQNRRLLDHLIDGLIDFRREKTRPELFWLLRLAAYQKIFVGGAPNYAIGDQAVAQARAVAGASAGGFVNAAVRRLIGALPSSEAELDTLLASPPLGPLGDEVRCSVTDDVAEALGAGYGPEALPGILRAANSDGTRVWLRPNRLKTSAPDLARSLAACGAITRVHDGCAEMLLWEGEGSAPWTTEPWRRGELTVQDLGAYFCVATLGVEPGRTVIDWCAAPGGKTGQIFEAMQGRGRLLAMEVDADRRRILGETLERLYGSGHRIEVAGPEDPTIDASGGRGLGADLVLVDAPCLGLGLLGRHPEIRWQGRLGGLDRIRARQTRILTQASAHVASGGRLAWVTCSPTQTENEEVVESWLESRPEWKAVDPIGLIPSWAEPWVQLSPTCVRTRPDLAPVDGFAMTILDRE